MNVLSLCSGAGGLEHGLALALALAELQLPAPAVLAYCERDACAVEILAARMEDGALAPAPIWFDVSTFDGRALAGRVDLVAAGYPCQPDSVAGDRQGADDERWLWREVWRVIREVGAGLAFLENVPGHLSGGRFGRVLGDLAEGGWSAEWDCVSAASVGAPHIRDRVFLLAADPECLLVRLEPRWRDGASGPDPGVTGDDGSSGSAADPTGSGLEERRIPRDELSAPERGSNGWAGRAPPEPAIRRVDDGVAGQVDGDRLHVLGNGVVPQAAARAFVHLFNRLVGGDA